MNYTIPYVRERNKNKGLDPKRGIQPLSFYVVIVDTES